MGSNRRNRARRSARRAATRDPRRRLLVVCEGKRTEPEYIKGYQRHVRNASVEVAIPNEQGDPKKVVEIAKALAEDAARQAKQHGDDYLKFDEVWCVFDRDEHERFHDACTMARANAFKLAVSNPCIELWLLLHFRDSPGARHRHDVQAMLASFIPSYDKGLTFTTVAAGVGDATRRARALDEDADEMDESGRNPTTSFYRLTDSIARKDP